MERELFSASPRAAQMARARLRLALGAFGSSYFTAGYCTSLSHSPLSRWKVDLARAVKDQPTFSHSTKSQCFSTPTSVSHFSRIQMYSTAHCVDVSCSALCSTVTRTNLFFIYRCMCMHLESQEAFLKRTHAAEALRQQCAECLTHSQMCCQSTQLQFLKTAKAEQAFSSSSLESPS